MGESSLRLGDLQLRIMKVLWGKGELAVSEVHRELPGGAELAPTTVATMLRKMEGRGLVRHRVEGRRFLYSAAVEEEQVGRGMADHVLDRVFEGSLSDMVSHLLRREDVSEEELSRIERMIAERKARK